MIRRMLNRTKGRHAMAKTWVDSVIGELRDEQKRLQGELRRVTVALGAFGKMHSRGSAKAGPRRKKVIISAAGRKRIAAAQRARWAKVRAAKQG